jgi:hypothetical protein
VARSQGCSPRRSSAGGRRGGACAAAFNSFFVQLSQLDRDDPSGLASTWVVAIKGVLAWLAVATLLATL